MTSVCRKAAYGFILVAFFLVEIPLAGCADTARKSDSAARALSSKSDERVLKILDRINSFRVSQGLSPLQQNPFIDKIAAGHSSNMATGKVDFGHQGFEQRAKAIQRKIKFHSMAENVGETVGKVDPAEEVVACWLKSPGHLKNIKGDFDLTGIGVAKKGKDYYFTQIFLK